MRVCDSTDEERRDTLNPENSQSNTCTILVVDDDSEMRSLLVDELSDNGCAVVECTNGSEAIFHLTGSEPNLIITDLKMPGGGFEYLENLRRAVPNCPIILMTAFGNSQTKKNAELCGIAAYFDKPVRINDLKIALQQVCPVMKLQSCQNTVKENV